MTRELKPHEQRVVEEHDELAVKLEALQAFMCTSTFESLEDEDQDLLKRQRYNMSGYLWCLAARISRF